MIYDQTDADGFVAASAVERILIENAVTGLCRKFNDHRIRSARKVTAIARE